MFTRFTYLLYLELLAGSSVQAALCTLSGTAPSPYRESVKEILSMRSIGMNFGESVNSLLDSFPTVGMQLLVDALLKVESSDQDIDSRLSIQDVFAPIFQVLPPLSEEACHVEPEVPAEQLKPSPDLLKTFIATCVELGLGFILLAKNDEAQNYLQKFKARVIQTDILTLAREEAIRLQREYPLIISTDLKEIKEWCGWRNGKPILQTLIYYEQIGMNREGEILGSHRIGFIKPSFLRWMGDAGKIVEMNKFFS